MKYIEIRHTNLLDQILIGSILGDGYLSPLIKGSVNSRLSYGHGEKQLDYLMWKYRILDKIGIVTAHGVSKYVSTNDRYKNGIQTSYHVRTISHPFITPYRIACYPDNKKALDFDIINNIGPLGLAIWYMDDGFITTTSCSFSTDCFSIEELLKLQVLLYDKFKILTTFGDTKQLHIRYNYFDRFVDVVSPFIIESMKYKLVPYKVLNKQGELLEHPEEDNQQPNANSDVVEVQRLTAESQADSNADTSTLQLN